MSHRAQGMLWGVGALAADQLTKALLLASGFAHAHHVAPFFNLVMVWNRGISFGMLASQNARWLLITVSVAAVLLLLRWLHRGVTRVQAAAIGLIAGGALGNAIDRLRFGAVADFFDFHIGSVH